MLWLDISISRSVIVISCQDNPFSGKLPETEKAVAESPDLWAPLNTIFIVRVGKVRYLKISIVCWTTSWHLHPLLSLRSLNYFCGRALEKKSLSFRSTIRWIKKNRKVLIILRVYYMFWFNGLQSRNIEGLNCCDQEAKRKKSKVMARFHY